MGTDFRAEQTRLIERSTPGRLALGGVESALCAAGTSAIARELTARVVHVNALQAG